MTTLAQILTDDFLGTHSLQTALKNAGVLNLPINGFCLNSQRIQEGEVFFVLKSAVNHDDKRTLKFVLEASKKASVIFSEIDYSQETFSAPFVYLPNLRDYMGSLYQAFLQHKQAYPLPSVMAVTGTNGKTSIATIAAQLLQNAKKTAVLGTAGNGIYPSLTPATHTTTDVLNVHKNLYEFAKQTAEVLCLEASSHGLHQQRLQGIPLKVAVYSNLSRDHLDYHHTMQEYARAKSLLFSKQQFPSLEYAIINADDEYASMMVTEAKQSNLTIWQYGFNEVADFYIQSYRTHLTGIEFELKTPFGSLTIDSPLLGIFNIHNLVASIASVLALGQPFAQLPKLIAQVTGVTGRMQTVHHHQVTYVVDYAHTPDAIEQVVSSLKVHGDEQSKIIIVFGCGGDRDRGKRPLMMQAALSADTVIITSDNPRTESIDVIIADMVAELTDAQKQTIHIQADRKKAIALAIQTADKNDIVLIAGKGHETYQEINGIRHDFDDMAVLNSLLVDS